MRKDFYDSARGRQSRPARRRPVRPAAQSHRAGAERRRAGRASSTASIPTRVTSREALAHLPVLRADDWPALRGDDPPFGGFANCRAASSRRVLMSPGPVYHPDVEGKDWGGAARALFAAGMRPRRRRAQLLLVSPEPVGFLMDSGAHALGCTVIAAGSDDADRGRRRDARARAARLCRRAGFPQADDRRVGRRDGAATIKHALVAGAPLTRGAAPRVRRRRASRCRNACCIPTSASSPMRATRSTA